MIKPSDIKFISEVAMDTSFYFIKERCMFLFETTPATIDWFTNWIHTYSDLKGLIIVSSMYGATIDDSPYMREVYSMFRTRFGRVFDIDAIYPKKGGCDDIKITVKLNNKQRVNITLVKDMKTKRCDVLFSDNNAKGIYYAGSSYGMNVSRMDAILLQDETNLTKRFDYIIFNLFNKFAMYNIHGTNREFFESLKAVFPVDPMFITYCGFPDNGTARFCNNEFKKMEVVGFSGRGATKPVIFHFGEGKEVETHES